MIKLEMSSSALKICKFVMDVVDVEWLVDLKQTETSLVATGPEPCLFQDLLT